jgi:hypothetical protein
MQLKDKSIEPESEELSAKGVLWVLVIMVVVVALMFASVYGKGYLAYGGMAFVVTSPVFSLASYGYQSLIEPKILYGDSFQKLNLFMGRINQYIFGNWVYSTRHI